MGGLASRIQLGRWAFLRGRDTRYKEAIAAVFRFIDGHVKRALQELQSQQSVHEESTAKEPPESYILLEAMAKETQDPMDLRYQLLHVFFPAHDSTAIAVSDIVFHLARSPIQWNRLRSEILAATSTKPLTFELLKSIKYLRYVFNES